ncbi:MAG: hypothetical protein N2037_11435 [Acidimicrobiales bacterium]|nr:hypothetical protein [Acidimicrobiales bacterium]
MPWCDDCAKFWNPNSLPPDGTCPICGQLIGDPVDTSVPWHFWLLLVATVVYLGWRLAQGLGWLVSEGYPLLAVGVGTATVILAGSGVVWLWRGRNRRAEHRGAAE